MRLLSLLAALPLAAMAEGAPPLSPEMVADYGPGGPPAMGTVSGTIAGRAETWTSYDYSIGAFDASAWITGEGGPGLQLTIAGYRAPGLMEDRIVILARLADLAPGPAQEATLSRIDEFWDEPLMTGAAEVQITAIRRFTAEDSYGEISGTVTGEICPVPPQKGDCAEAVLQFTTRLQFENM